MATRRIISIIMIIIIIIGIIITFILNPFAESDSTKATNDLVVELIKPRCKIRGRTLENAKNKPYYAFQEIPYAAPPIGENRFRPPKPHPGWDGVLNTTQNTKRCYQFVFFGPEQLNFGNDKLTMSEDCLFLNVYTPVKPGSNETLPVLFFIHGGCFAFDDSSFYNFNPNYLIDGNIIIVTVDYRLGPFGFLAIKGSDISGNMALKDQRMALIWTYENIHAFGGDPENIIVGGQSSGAFSAGYHLLNPRNKGLISGVIQQSGSPLSGAAYMVSSQAYALSLGRSIDPSIASDDVEHLLDTLYKATADEIQATARKVLNPYPLGLFPNPSWGPVVESEDVEDAFITSPMHEAFSKGNFIRVPILMSFNSEESLVLLPALGEAVVEKEAARVDANLSLLVGQSIRVDNRTLVGTELRKVYTSKTFSEDPGAFIKYTSDVIFTNPMSRQAELTSKYVPVYVYELSAGGNNDSVFGGIPHSYDLRYFWNMQTKKFGNLTIDESVREYSLALWWNFIKYKNPTPKKEIEWLPVSPGEIRYLDVGYKVTIKANPRNYKAVKEIYEKYVKPPFYIF